MKPEPSSFSVNCVRLQYSIPADISIIETNSRRMCVFGLIATVYDNCLIFINKCMKVMIRETDEFAYQLDIYRTTSYLIS
jgi:hypothetical protein